MKLENMQRLLNCAAENNTFLDNLEMLYKVKEKIERGDGGIVIGENERDTTDLFSIDNDYNQSLNEELINSVISIIEKHHLRLKEEIETL